MGIFVLHVHCSLDSCEFSLFQLALLATTRYSYFALFYKIAGNLGYTCILPIQHSETNLVLVFTACFQGLAPSGTGRPSMYVHGRT